MSPKDKVFFFCLGHPENSSTPLFFPPLDDLLDVSSDDLNMKIHLKIIHVWVISFRHYLI